MPFKAKAGRLFKPFRSSKYLMHVKEILDLYQEVIVKKIKYE